MSDTSKFAFSVSEVAEMLGLGRTAVYDAVRSGQIQSVRVGKRILIPRSALESLLQPGHRDEG